MRKVITIVAFAALLGAAPAQAHLVRVPDHPKKSHLENRLASQTENLGHARYVCNNGANAHKLWACKAVKWLSRERNETRAALAPKVETGSVTYWMNKQIAAANHLAANSGADPWPNCPDPGPRDNQGAGHSWFDTVNCENGGNWLDSPGYYRCGLQFDPGWESVYGRLCP